MSDDIAIKVENVSKRYCKSLKKSMIYGISDITRNMIGLSSHSYRLRKSEFLALDDVSFELKKGETLGVVGPNGSGKTTLLKTLNGIFWPDKGKITVKGRVGALIAVGAGFHPLLTGRENIYINGAILGINKKEIDQKFDEIVDFADIGDFLDTPVNYYSSGMFVKLGFAVAIHSDPEILLIDEILSVGDVKFQAKCLNRIGKLKRNGVTFILVSHNIRIITGYADRVLMLDHGKTYAFGDPESTVDKYVALMKSDSIKDDFYDDSMPNGSGRVQFKNARFCNNIGDTVERLDATEPANLIIDYEAIDNFKNAELNIALYNGKDETFFQASNLLYNQPLQITKGYGIIRISFPCLPSNGGSLKVNIAIWSEAREELLDWRRNIKVDIVGCSLSPGRLWLPCSFEINSIG